MDPLRILAETLGFFTRAMARDAGYSDRAIDAMYRQGIWLRFRHGCYTFPDLWQVADEYERHRIRCRAVLHALGPSVVLSHVSSLIMQGIQPWGIDLSRVHVTRLDKGAGRIEGDVVHHKALLGPNDVFEQDGVRMVLAARAVIEAASLKGGEVAFCLLNQVLHAELVDLDVLAARFEHMQRWPRMRRLHIPIRMADPRCASVGESRGMWLFRIFHIPKPEIQFKVFDGDGVLRGTCDWGWPEHKGLGEFDGQLKYGRLLKPGQEPGDVVFAEKHREDLLRELTGFGMVRIIWSDYERPQVTARRVEQMLRRAA